MFLLSPVFNSFRFAQTASEVLPRRGKNKARRIHALRTAGEEREGGGDCWSPVLFPSLRKEAVERTAQTAPEQRFGGVVDQKKPASTQEDNERPAEAAEGHKSDPHNPRGLPCFPGIRARFRAKALL